MTEAVDAKGGRWFFDVAGPYTSYRGGMARSDVVWKALGRAHALRGVEVGPLVFLTTQLPAPASEGGVALRAAGREAFFDVIDLLSASDRARLVRYSGGDAVGPASTEATSGPATSPT